MPDILEFEWALVIDLDEYLVLNRDIFPTIQDFCNWHSDRGAEAVAINWAFLRSEEIPVKGSLPLPYRNERLLTAAEMGEGVRLVKSMSRPNRVCHSEAHVPFVDERSGLARFNAAGREHEWHKPATGFPNAPKFADDILDDAAVIYHYIYKSADEWLWKNARNAGDHRLTGNDNLQPMSEMRAQNFLTQYDSVNLEVTRRATACVPDLISEIETLKQQPDVAAIHASLHRRYEDKLAALKSLYATSPDVGSWNEATKRFLMIAEIK